jgi:serine/tyrosine/threonine adenylyltransferase
VKPATELASVAPLTAGWRLDHSYARLPDRLFARVSPTAVTQPHLIVLNRPLAEYLGLDSAALGAPENAGWFTGNTLPPGAAPIAQAYAGHQYGNFVILGDGRAILLGEQVTPGGERFDIQLKGPGRTPFSRRGDGRAGLAPMLREYIISEAMHALGIPTTRSLAVAVTGEPVFRETMLLGAVLTRVAASHIRVGTFEWTAAMNDLEALRALTNYTLRRHYPEQKDAEHPARALLQAAIDRQAALIARWQLVGFVHGVMNTDNMALSGETIDYGPCAFMDAFHPATVFSSIDHHGRYAYGNQPSIAHWNLSRLASALLPLLHDSEEEAVNVANEILRSFPEHFRADWLTGMRAKLGLFNEEASDEALTNDLLAVMQERGADFTNTFRDLSRDVVTDTALATAAEFQSWRTRWQERLSRQPQSLDESRALMRRHNPTFIPRNHKVEEALAAATGNGDLSVMEKLLEVLRHPYDYEHDLPEFSTPAPSSCGRYQTFCGT